MTQHQVAGIITPHDHDVLSGRGNFVNYHSGNERFRALVRKHKVAYVACPKAKKGQFSKLIVDEIKSLNPPGRFLKQDPQTKLWIDIGDKKALDKTRQALREGAPDIMKELHGDEEGPVPSPGSNSKASLDSPNAPSGVSRNNSLSGSSHHNCSPSSGPSRGVQQTLSMGALRTAASNHGMQQRYAPSRSHSDDGLNLAGGFNGGSGLSSSTHSSGLNSSLHGSNHQPLQMQGQMFSMQQQAQQQQFMGSSHMPLHQQHHRQQHRSSLPDVSNNNMMGMMSVPQQHRHSMTGAQFPGSPPGGMVQQHSGQFMGMQSPTQQQQVDPSMYMDAQQQHSEQFLQLQQQQRAQQHQQQIQQPTGMNLQGIPQDNVLGGMYSPQAASMMQNKMSNLTNNSGHYSPQQSPQQHQMQQGGVGYGNNSKDSGMYMSRQMGVNLDAAPQPHPNDRFESERVMPSSSQRNNSNNNNSINKSLNTLKLPSRGIKRESSENSIQVDNVFGGMNVNKSNNGNSNNPGNTLSGGDSSVMSLSIGDMGVVPEHSDTGDGDPLSLGNASSSKNANGRYGNNKASPLLESSVMSLASLTIDDVDVQQPQNSSSNQQTPEAVGSTLTQRLRGLHKPNNNTSNNRPEIRRIPSNDYGNNNNSNQNSTGVEEMEMSVNTLGGVLSDFGDVSLARIGAESFSNFFEETDQELFVNR